VDRRAAQVVRLAQRVDGTPYWREIDVRFSPRRTRWRVSGAGRRPPRRRAARRLAHERRANGSTRSTAQQAMRAVGRRRHAVEGGLSANMSSRVMPARSAAREVHLLSGSTMPKYGWLGWARSEPVAAGSATMRLIASSFGTLVARRPQVELKKSRARRLGIALDGAADRALTAVVGAIARYQSPLK